MSTSGQASTPSLSGTSAFSPAPQTPPAQRILTLLARGFLVAVALWLIVLGVFNLRHPSDWAMGDWLINYSGGFVRRGLTGQAALELHALHLPLLGVVLLLQWLLYAVILTALWRLVTRTRWAWWSAALFFSPATVAFVLLDPPFAFRKDILFLALLTAVVVPFSSGPSNQNVPPTRRTALLLTLGCAVCVLAHEGLIVFFPYLFAGVLLRIGSLRRAAQILLAPALVSVALFVIVSRFPGSPAVAAAVCRSIGGTLTSPPTGICGGAIDYLAHNAAYAHLQVLHVMLSSPLWLRVPFLFVLPLVPVILALVRLRRDAPHAAQVVLTAAVISALLSISLFFYGTDWTRWIYLHTFSLMLLLLFAAQQQSSALQLSDWLSFEGSRRWLAWALLALYCLGWELTPYRPRPVYGSFARFATHNLARGQQ